MWIGHATREWVVWHTALSALHELAVSHHQSHMNGSRHIWIVGHDTCVFEQTELTARLLDYFLLSNKININQWTISHTALRAVHEFDVSYRESPVNGPCPSWKSRATCDFVTAHTTVRALHELDICHHKSSMRRESRVKFVDSKSFEIRVCEKREMKFVGEREREFCQVRERCHLLWHITWRKTN